jgi:hypothetical protein
MAISAETLNVILKAKDKDFARQMKSNERRVANFSKKSNARLKGTTAHFQKLGGAAAAFLPALGAAAMVSAVKNVVSKLDDIGKTADRIGITTDALQELRAVAESAGVEQSALDNSIEKLGKGLAEASMGIGTAQYALDELGLSANDLMSLGLDGALAKIADEINKVPDPMQKTALATQLFGRSGAPMLNLLREGAAGMDKMRQEARELGIVIDEDLIRNAEEAQTQLDLMSRVISANLSSALINIAPLLVNAATSIAQLSSAAREFFSIGTQAEADSLTASLEALDLARTNLLDGGSFDDLGFMDKLAFVMDTREIENLRGELSLVNFSLNKSKAAANEAAEAAAALLQIDRAADGITSANARVEAATELARLRGISAEAAERERISREKQSIIDSAMIGNAGATFDAASTRVLLEAQALGEEYEAAAIAASSILNPVKAVAAAGAGAAASIKSVVDVVAELSPMLSRLGFDAESFNGIMQTVEGSIESAFMSMDDGASTASEAFKSMASEIIKELYRVLVVKQITGFITDTISLATGQTGFFDGLAGAPVSGRASGGSVASGRGYMVGENGPEPFIPAQNGRILSVGQAQAAVAGGGSGVTVIQNNTFGNGVNRAEINGMLPKLVEASKAAVYDAQRRSVNGR